MWTYVTADLLKSRMLWNMWNVWFFFLFDILGFAQALELWSAGTILGPMVALEWKCLRFCPFIFAPILWVLPNKTKKKLQALFGSTHLDLFANLRNMQNLILRTCFMIFGLSSQILLFNSSPWEPQQLSKTFVSSCNSQVHRFTQNLKGICMRSFWGSVSDPLVTAQYHSIWH